MRCGGMQVGNVNDPFLFCFPVFVPSKEENESMEEDIFSVFVVQSSNTHNSVPVPGGEDNQRVEERSLWSL